MAASSTRVAAAESADPPPRIDWIPASDIGDGRPGRIGMTVVPGKRGASMRYPGVVYRADLDEDLRALRAAGIARLVLLVEDEELARWSDARMVERAAAHGVEVLRHPMPDGAPPSSVTAVDEILDAIDGARAHGDVALACMGGVGRTGTVAACALVRAGWESPAAIARVRALRHPGAVETRAQERFVRSYWRVRRARSDTVSP
jgi:protein-tyrosine phosphatase